MTTRTPWEPGYSVGHALVDAQHQQLLAQCELLAELCEGAAGPAAERAFDEAFERLKSLARAHFETEAPLLARGGYPDLEEHRIDCDEFEYLAGEIATADNFDRVELQRFLALWWVGHVTAAARGQRGYLVEDTPAA